MVKPSEMLGKILVLFIHALAVFIIARTKHMTEQFKEGASGLTV